MMVRDRIGLFLSILIIFCSGQYIFPITHAAQIFDTYFNETGATPINTTADQDGENSASSLENSESLSLEKADLVARSVSNFYLWTREFREGKLQEIIDPRNVSSVKYSHFNAGNTYVIIHGFLGYGLEPWIKRLKRKLLDREDCNVISVDWPAGSSWFLPTYYTASKRVPRVGRDTMTLIESLQMYKGLVLENLHFIGHSLGAHAAGFASKSFEGRVGRITGLDPAGPLFHKLDGKKRLDKSDAVFVDIIHTNGCNIWPYWTDCYGLGENIGHVDFWPNGGKHQPYCNGNSKQLKGDIGCDHEIAYKYFIESFDYEETTTYFMSRPCTSWIMFMTGNCSCGVRPQFMGVNVNPEVEGKQYLDTSGFPPFAITDDDCSPRNLHVNMMATVVGGIGLIIFIIIIALCWVFPGWCCCNGTVSERTPLLRS